MSNEIEPVQNQPERADGAVASMVCGIVGVVTSCVPAAGIVLGIVAIILYTKVNKRIIESKGKLEGKGMAIAGLVCGIVAVVFGVFYLIYWIVYGLVLGALFTGALFK
jgi:hypothetical protein